MTILFFERQEKHILFFEFVILSKHIYLLYKSTTNQLTSLRTFFIYKEKTTT